MSSIVRIKIELKHKILNLENFWYHLDMKQIDTVEKLRDDIFRKLDYFLNSKHLETLIHPSNLRLFVYDHELPIFETTRILRDSDTVS